MPQSRFARSPLAFGAAVMLGAAAPASALEIKVHDAVSTVAVVDNGAGDTAAAVGLLNFVAAPADLSAWDKVAVQGAFDVLGLDRTLSVSVEADNSGAAGTLFVEVTHTGYTLDDALFGGLHSLSGTTVGTVEMESFWDPGNVAFAKTTSIGGPFSFATPAIERPFSRSFSTDLFDLEAGATPFSITTVLKISHPAERNATLITSSAEVFGFDGGNVEVIPLPAAAPLLAVGLGLLGALRLRRKA